MGAGILKEEINTTRNCTLKTNINEYFYSQYL